MKQISYWKDTNSLFPPNYCIYSVFKKKCNWILSHCQQTSFSLSNSTRMKDFQALLEKKSHVSIAADGSGRELMNTSNSCRVIWCGNGCWLNPFPLKFLSQRLTPFSLHTVLGSIAYVNILIIAALNPILTSWLSERGCKMNHKVSIKYPL